jgi:hypothetical protein
MKKIFIFLLFLFPFDSNSQNWELIPALSWFTNPIILGDTLIGINDYKSLAVFKNKKWDTIDYKTTLIESVSDTIVKERIISFNASLSKIYLDNNNNKWTVLKGESDFFSSFIFFDNGNTIKIFDSYRQIDSSNDTKINNVYFIGFTNDSIPYFIMNNKVERTTCVSLCKLQDNKIIEIHKHYNSAHGSSSKGICFDSKNNFWFNNSDSLFYYSKDTISKRFALKDFPKTDYVQGGFITKVCIDANDKVYAVSSLFGLFFYENNIWILDTMFSANCFAVSLMWHDDEFQSMELDSKGNLWFYHIMPFLYRRDKTGIWSKYIIPNASCSLENVGAGKFNGYLFDSIIIDSKDRIWLFGISTGKYWIYLPDEGEGK